MTVLAWVLIGLALPAAQASVWRWQDTSGKLHYSNVREHVPPHAVRVDRQVGFVAVAPPRRDLVRHRASRHDPERFGDAALSTSDVDPWRPWAVPTEPWPVVACPPSGIEPAWPQRWLARAVTELDLRKCSAW